MLEFEDFDIVDGIAIDAMHLLHLGITKKLWDLLDSSAVTLPRAKKQEITSAWHHIFIRMKVTSEMCHKTSDLAVTSTFKALDWQLLDTFAFPTMAMAMDCGQDIQIIMMTYSYLVRMLYMPDQEIHLSSDRHYQIIKMIFLRTVVRIFGEQTLT